MIRGRVRIMSRSRAGSFDTPAPNASREGRRRGADAAVPFPLGGAPFPPEPLPVAVVAASAIISPSPASCRAPSATLSLSATPWLPGAGAGGGADGGGAGPALRRNAGRSTPVHDLAVGVSGAALLVPTAVLASPGAAGSSQAAAPPSGRRGFSVRHHASRSAAAAPAPAAAVAAEAAAPVVVLAAAVAPGAVPAAASVATPGGGGGRMETFVWGHGLDEFRPVPWGPPRVRPIWARDLTQRREVLHEEISRFALLQEREFLRHRQAARAAACADEAQVAAACCDRDRKESLFLAYRRRLWELEENLFTRRGWVLKHDWAHQRAAEAKCAHRLAASP